MSYRVPVSRQIAWLSLVPQLFIIFLVMYLFKVAGVEEPATFGAITYLIISVLLKLVIAKDHRRGMSLVKSQRFEEAIPYFQKSYDFFNKNMWVDKWRSITMLSSSAITYREMAMLNHAFCLSQIGKGVEAHELYKATLSEFPDSSLALTAIRIYDSAKN